MLTLALLFAGSAQAVTVELEPGADVASLTAAMGPGDSFIFHAGTYELPGPLTWVGVGTEVDPIHITDAGDGEVILRLMAGGHIVRLNDSAFVNVDNLTLEGDDTHYQENGFTGLVINNSADISVSNMVVRHVGSHGFVFANDNQRLSITENDLSDMRTGVGMSAGCGNASCWMSDSVIANNLVHDVIGDRRYGIELLPGCQGNTIANNVVFNVTGIGIGVSTTEFGPANQVVGNVVWDATNTGIRTAGASVVRNNIVFRIEGNGIRASNQFADSLQDVVISHNTVVDTTDYGIRIESWEGKTGMVLTNNAIANPTGRAFSVDEDEFDEGNYISGNVMTGLVDRLDALMGHFSPGLGYGDFEDPAAWDFYPTPSSSLLGMGDPAADAWVPEVDFSDFARDGSGPDVGAYEYVGDGNPGWIVQEDFKGDAELPTVGEDVGGGCCGDKGSDAGVFLWPLLGLFALRRRRRAV